jgi:hypothetical protein
VTRGLPCLVNGDPARLRQIFFNLCGGLLRCKDAKNVVITVEACAAQEVIASKPAKGAQNNASVANADVHADLVHLAFRIQDANIYLSESKLAQLFDPFTRADVSDQQGLFGKSGSPLGLSIAKSLIEAMHGTLVVTSSKAAGTALAFTLTFATKTGSPSQAPVYKITPLSRLRTLNRGQSTHSLKKSPRGVGELGPLDFDRGLLDGIPTMRDDMVGRKTFKSTAKEVSIAMGPLDSLEQEQNRKEQVLKARLASGALQVPSSPERHTFWSPSEPSRGLDLSNSSAIYPPRDSEDYFGDRDTDDGMKRVSKAVSKERRKSKIDNVKSDGRYITVLIVVRPASLFTHTLTRLQHTNLHAQEDEFINQKVQPASLYMHKLTRTQGAHMRVIAPLSSEHILLPTHSPAHPYTHTRTHKQAHTRSNYKVATRLLERASFVTELAENGQKVKTCIHANTLTRLRTNTCTYFDAHTCTHIHLHAHEYTELHKYSHSNIYKQSQTHIETYKHRHTLTHAHTHKHAPKHAPIHTQAIEKIMENVDHFDVILMVPNLCMSIDCTS